MASSPSTACPGPAPSASITPQGDSVRWRIINATADIHPLHLHGFYFRVTARGDVNRDTLYWPAQERMAVTELLDEGTTMNLAWYADRPGAWVFHCHLNWHVVPNPALGDAGKRTACGCTNSSPRPTCTRCRRWPNHAETGMGGLCCAWTSHRPRLASRTPARASVSISTSRATRSRATRRAASAMRSRTATSPGIDRDCSGPGRRSSCTRGSRRASSSSIAWRSRRRCTGTASSSTATTTAWPASAATQAWSHR